MFLAQARTLYSSLLIGASLSISAASTHASLITFTNETEWLAALAPHSLTRELFTGAASQFVANSNGNVLGSTTVDIVGGINDSGPSGLTGTGYLQGEVDANRNTALSMTFHIPDSQGFALLGLQNDSASNAGGLHLEEIAIDVGGQQWLISDILGLSHVDDALPIPNTTLDDAIPFIGFVSSESLNQWSLIPGEQVRDVSGNTEEFYLQGVQYAQTLGDQSGGVEVPEPSSALLMLTGLLGLARVRRAASRSTLRAVLPKRPGS
jgi:hypothetical protein